MSSVKYAPRMMQGEVFFTAPRICDSGNTVNVTIEIFYTGDDRIGLNTQKIGKPMYMWIVNNESNYRLYASTITAMRAVYKRY